MTSETGLSIQLAPLQGFTDSVFRNALHRWFGGVEVYYTPFVRMEHGKIPNRCRRDMEGAQNRVPRLVPQLMAADADEAENVLDTILAYGYREVDINMGCPFPLQVKRHRGCGLLPHPDRVAALLRVVERHPDIRFSVKMRLGWESAEEGMALLPLLNALPLRQLTVHARLGIQQYKGECRTDDFARMAAGCTLPLYYNGDITTAADVERIRAAVPTLSGVVVGRGLLAHPWLAAEVGSGTRLDEEQRRERLRAFHADLLDGYEKLLEGGEQQLLTKMKTVWDYLLPELPRKDRKKIGKARRMADYMEAIRAALY